MKPFKNIDEILKHYYDSFKSKTHNSENMDYDFLMNVFNISPELKQENKQYWGRELGKCWERLVVSIFEDLDGFKPALKIESDEPCDLIFNKYAIDTKYRVGSGDSGTLKKFRQYGKLLQELGYTPVLLFVREDNLPSAITACIKGGWEIYTGDDCIEFIKKNTDIDIKLLLEKKGSEFHL